MPEQRPHQTPTKPTDLAEIIRAGLRERAADRPARPTTGEGQRDRGKVRGAGRGGVNRRQYAFRRS